MDLNKENQRSKFLSDLKEATEHLRNIGNSAASLTLQSILNGIEQSSNKDLSIDSWMSAVTNARFTEEIGKNPDASLDWIDGNDTMRDLIRQGKKIHCIKIIRMYTGYGLAEAKQFLDANWFRWHQKISDEDESNGSVA